MSRLPKFKLGFYRPVNITEDNERAQRREVGFGSKAAVGEPRSITYQAVLYGCTTFVAVRPLNRDRSNSVTCAFPHGASHEAAEFPRVGEGHDAAQWLVEADRNRHLGPFCGRN